MITTMDTVMERKLDIAMERRRRKKDTVIRMIMEKQVMDMLMRAVQEKQLKDMVTVMAMAMVMGMKIRNWVQIWMQHRNREEV